MSCPQTINGIANDCSASIGGIRVAYIANHSDVTKVTVEDGMITEIEAAKDAFKAFNFKKNTGSFTTNAQISEESGSVFEMTDIVLQFTKMETSKRMEVAALSLGELAVIVKDRNGKYWYFGYDNPVTRSAGIAQSGTMNTDLNGYNITLQDEALQLPYEVEESVVEGLLK